MIPEDPQALLTRDEAATALTKSGFPTAAATLATLKCRGGGPPVEVFGNKPLHRWGPTLAWAKNRAARPRKAA